MYKQSSGITMGIAPAPDLANDFAFMHELDFLNVMIYRFLLDTRNNVKPRSALEIVEQYGSNTKRFIGDTITVAPGLTKKEKSHF